MLFNSFFLGGFECSTHIIRTGQRLDMLAATQHDRYAREDYERLKQLGILTARDGLRWHLIEAQTGHFDFSSALPMIRAARAVGTQVIWDLLHYGWPPDIDFFSQGFVERFAAYAHQVALLLRQETDTPPLLTPINEVSFMAWAGGNADPSMHPFAQGRADDIKRQLVSAVIAGIDAVRAVSPEARFIQSEPIIKVKAHPERPAERVLAAGQHQAQYQAWDMLTGRMNPSLGGSDAYLDIIGVNYYPWNQWYYDNENGSGPTIRRGEPGFTPLRQMLREVYERYNRPLFIAETSTEDDKRAAWMDYICSEVQAAIAEGIPVGGICWYPILDHPGWENDRMCCNGLWSYPAEGGGRQVHQPLLEVLQKYQPHFPPPRQPEGPSVVR